MILMSMDYTKLLICLMRTFTSKKDFVLDQTNHLNFKFEVVEIHLKKKGNY